MKNAFWGRQNRSLAGVIALIAIAGAVSLLTAGCTPAAEQTPTPAPPPAAGAPANLDPKEAAGHLPVGPYPGGKR